MGIPSADIPSADIPSADIPSADIPSAGIPNAANWDLPGTGTSSGTSLGTSRFFTYMKNYFERVRSLWLECQFGSILDPPRRSLGFTRNGSDGSFAPSVSFLCLCGHLEGWAFQQAWGHQHGHGQRQLEG